MARKSNTAALKVAATPQVEVIPLAAGTFVPVEEKKTCFKFQRIDEGSGPKMFVGNEDVIWPLKALITGMVPGDKIRVTLEVIREK